MNRPTDHPENMPINWPLVDFVNGGHLHFLHIGKCAGTSVRLLAQSCFSASETYQHRVASHGYLPPRRFIEEWNGDTQGAFSSDHLGSTIFEICEQPLNVFTWLRDPMETSISTLYFIKQQVEIAARRAPSFLAVAEIVSASNGPYDAFMRVSDHLKGQPVREFHPFRPLTYLLAQPARLADLPTADVVSSAVKTLHQCFFIGLLEEQAASLEMFSRFVPLRCPQRTFRMNPTLVRPDTVAALTETQISEIKTVLVGEYQVYEEGKRLWELQKSALQQEGWLDQTSDERTAHAFRRLYPTFQPQGRWTADAAAFAEGFSDFEFHDATAGRDKLFWRWTSPGERAAIRLPIQPGQQVRLSIEISKITPKPQLEGLRLAVGGVPLPLAPMTSTAGGYRFEAIVPNEQLSESGTEIEILNDCPFRPSISDPRRLGAAVLAIAWQPQ